MNVRFDCRHRYADGFRLQAAFAAEGQCTVLFGPSGSGKTSILSMIAGVLRPDSGRISVDGRIVLDTSDGICLRPEHRHVGYVFQESNLFPHMSVRQNLEFGQRWRKSLQNGTDLRRIIDVLEIETLLERRPGSLSGGEKQRVALGRALASSPRLLLMDEPVAHLDSHLRSKVLDYLQRSLEEWNIPALYVTHSREEADLLADRILNIRQGQVVENQSD
jgi:molybdate transport system ATP-binding protein